MVSRLAAAVRGRLILSFSGVTPMAFSKNQLRNSGRPIRLSSVKFIRFLTYATNDVEAVVIAGGYFNEARADLSVGSVIHAEVDCGGTQVSVRMRVTAVPSTGNVTVAKIT
jgi:hypothetical protein